MAVLAVGCPGPETGPGAHECPDNLHGQLAVDSPGIFIFYSGERVSVMRRLVLVLLKPKDFEYLTNLAAGAGLNRRQLATFAVRQFLQNKLNRGNLSQR